MHFFPPDKAAGNGGAFGLLKIQKETAVQGLVENQTLHFFA